MERFWTKVEIGLCWIWTAARYSNGYGHFRVDAGRGALAHRFAWELLVGPIPEGLELDHLCRNRLCVNPDHLELTTHRENTLRGTSPAARQARKTHCPQGHAYDEANTYHWRGHRRCRICARRKMREFYLRRRDAR